MPEKRVDPSLIPSREHVPPGLGGRSPVIRISIRQQRLSFLGRSYPISTGKAGTGSEPDSGKTPLGLFSVCSRHGENAPLATIFRSRLPIGLWSPSMRSRDAILARILCLDGLEEHNANTRERYIYIHGTNDIAHLGSPVSHGCIRLAPEDMAELFERVPLRTRVVIET